MSERLTLLPCPFCGSSAEGDTGFFPLTNLLYVWCSNAECGCSPKGRGERMFLPEEWNHRAALRSLQPAEQPNAAQDGLAEELERIFTEEFALHSGPEDCPTYYDGCNCCGPDAVRELFRQRDEAIASLSPSPKPAEQQEVVAWTTELALETAKQIGSIGFTVCPENIWGDKGVALTRARPASVAGDSVRVPKDE